MLKERGEKIIIIIKGIYKNFKIVFDRMTKENSIIKNEQFPNTCHFRKRIFPTYIIFCGILT